MRKIQLASAVMLSSQLAACILPTPYYFREYSVKCATKDPAVLADIVRQIANDMVAKFGGYSEPYREYSQGFTIHLPLTQGGPEANPNASYFLSVGRWQNGKGISIVIERSDQLREDDRAKEIRSFIESELIRFNCPNWNVGMQDVLY